MPRRLLKKNSEMFLSFADIPSADDANLNLPTVYERMLRIPTLESSYSRVVCIILSYYTTSS